MNATQIENLQKLSQWMKDNVIVDELPFSMWMYIKTEDYDELLDFAHNPISCGTPACLLGWSAHALGLEKDLQNVMEARGDYDAFYNMISEVHLGINGFSQAWEWLFDAHWTAVNDTAEFAVERLDYLIENGPPHEFKFESNIQDAVIEKSRRGINESI